MRSVLQGSGVMRTIREQIARIDDGSVLEDDLADRVARVEHGLRILPVDWRMWGSFGHPDLLLHEVVADESDGRADVFGVHDSEGRDDHGTPA